MMPTYSERQDLAKQFAADIARMQCCLQAADKQAEIDDVVYAWADYSDAVCAGWLMLPESEDELLAILFKHLPASRRAWQIKAEDAGDGSGDIVLTLPEELLARTGWEVGVKLSIELIESGVLLLQRME
jgi:hypothetical protein